MNQTKKPPERIIQRVTAQPWLVRRDHMQLILDVLHREGDLETFASRRGQAQERDEGIPTREGVAVLKVHGTIFPYANIVTELSGGTSLDQLTAEFIAARDSPDVRAILMHFDSPGGYSVGISEFADLVYEARSVKPVVAYVYGDASSAAYWAASAAGELYVNDLGLVGSIGTVVAIPDHREAEAREGRTTYEIVSSQSPKKRPDPATDTGRAQIQATLDSMTDVFISKVARFRGVTQKTVRADFGEGDVLLGAKAVRAGMADGVSSLARIMDRLTGNRGKQVSEIQQEHGALTVESLKAAHGGLYQSVKMEGEQEERARIQRCLHAAGVAMGADLERVIFQDLASEAEVQAYLWTAYQSKLAKSKAERISDARELENVGADTEQSANSEDDSGDRVAEMANRIRGY